MSSSRRIRLLFALLAAVLFSFGPSLSFSQAGAASGCMDNNLVKSFAVASPRRGALVRDPFYLKLDATVFDADAFTAINERFSLCIESQLLDQQHNSGHSASNSYYRQCGLHVFDDHAVPGLRPALTSPSEVLDVQLQSVTVSLHYRHESEDVLLCSSHTEVLCCSEEEDPSLTSADSSASDVLATDPSKRKAVIASFLQFFEKLKLKEAPTVQLPERLLQATRDSPADRNIITVLIGIKSFAMNAAKRQAIRDTWLSNRLVCTPAHCIEVVPVFIVGNSPYASSNLEIAECLLIEQEMHRDLLLGFNSSALSAIGVGIPVEDSYFSLPQKVLHFFAWAVNGGAAAYLRHMHRSDDGRDDNSSPFDLNALVKCDIHRDNNYIFRGCYHSKDSTEDFLTKFDYVVIADDDVYVDLQQLNKVLCDPATPKNYFYAGEVLETAKQHTFRPIRQAKHTHYISELDYPADSLPPFALGNFYVLSNDVSLFVGSNSQFLRPVGHLEDLSVSIWLSAIQVAPMHLGGVCNAETCCYNKRMYEANPHPITDRKGKRLPIGEEFLVVSSLESVDGYLAIHQALKHRHDYNVSNKLKSENLKHNEWVAALSSVLIDMVESTDSPLYLESQYNSAPAYKVKAARRKENSNKIPDNSTPANEENCIHSSISGQRTGRVGILVSKLSVSEELDFASSAVIAVLKQNKIMLNDFVDKEQQNNIANNLLWVEILSTSNLADTEYLDLLRSLPVPLRLFHSTWEELSSALKVIRRERENLNDDSGAFCNFLSNTGIANNTYVRHLLSFDAVVTAEQPSSSSCWSNEVLEDACTTEHTSFLLQLISSCTCSGYHSPDMLRYKQLEETNKFILTKDDNVNNADNGLDIPSLATSWRQKFSTSQQPIERHESTSRYESIPEIVKSSNVMQQEVPSYLSGDFKIITGSYSAYALPIIRRMLSVVFPSKSLSAMLVVDFDHLLMIMGACNSTSYSEIHSGCASNEQMEFVESIRQFLTAPESDIIFLATILDFGGVEEETGNFAWITNSSYQKSSQSIFTAVQQLFQANFTIFLCSEPTNLSTMNSSGVSLILHSTNNNRMQPALDSSDTRTSVLFLPVFSLTAIELQHQVHHRSETAQGSDNTIALYCTSVSCLYDKLVRPDSQQRIDRLVKDNRSGIAYLYYRCDRWEREFFFSTLHGRFTEMVDCTNYIHFNKGVSGTHVCRDNSHVTLVHVEGESPAWGDVLNQTKHVVALGKCRGGSYTEQNSSRGGFSSEQHKSKSLKDRISSRYDTDYLLSAIEAYSQFKFVIAFENTVEYSGYITEKLTNAYLAGAVPIYWGPCDVTTYFNISSMIMCNTLCDGNKSAPKNRSVVQIVLQECVQRVLEVYMDDKLYASMRQTPPLIGASTQARSRLYHQLFPWEMDEMGRYDTQFLATVQSSFYKDRARRI